MVINVSTPATAKDVYTEIFQITNLW